MIGEPTSDRGDVFGLVCCEVLDGGRLTTISLYCDKYAP